MYRLIAAFILSLFGIGAGFSQTSQNAPVRDQRAVLLVQQSLVAMATVQPADSTETGNVQVAGSGQGSIRILTRGLSQTLLQVQTPSQTRTIVYSQGEANGTNAGVTSALPLERASTSQCSFFPLPYLTSILQNPDVALQFVGTENLGGTSVRHLRSQNTFQSKPLYRFLSPFTVTDIWLDAASNLPRRIAFIRRDGGGATPKMAVVVDYSNYQTLAGVQYPELIQETVNGSPSMTVSIQSAQFNVGLSDTDFPMVAEGN
jgi:hypothetical protein